MHTSMKMATSSLDHCKTMTAVALDNELEDIDNMLKRRDIESKNAVIKKLKNLGKTYGEDITKILLTYRNKQGDTLAHTAATYHEKPQVMKQILKMSPGLLMETRKGSLEGQTVLHLTVSRRKHKMAQALLRQQFDKERGEIHTEKKRVLSKLLKTQAVGPKFKNTVMMGQLPLSVAALTYDEFMVSLLLDYGADIAWQNANGDTVFHSLIRYTSVHMDKIDDTLNMINALNERLCPYINQIKKPNKPHLWHIVNKQGMTPLQLAASLGQKKVFCSILNLEETYRCLSYEDGVFGDVFLYDITEIDTVTQAEWERYPPKGLTMESALDSNKKSWLDPGHWPVLSHTSPAVLELLCQLPIQQAYRFLCIDVIKELINQKWNHYKAFLLLWVLFHVLVMIHITIYAVYKTKVLNSHLYSDYHVSQEVSNFVHATAGIIFLYALVNLFPEAAGFFNFGKKWYFRSMSSNDLYRAMLVVFSSALIIDSIWFFSHPQNNYFLILALITGWIYMGFFLRTLKRFSFSTVMFLKIIAGDLARLAVIILFQLIAFTTAIYTTFHSVPSAEGFENVGRAIITMINLMLGLNDVDILNDAREPWLAILLYIVFVLITYILLLNSLIAMMSMTCERITEDRDAQWQLQRLSVILLLEATFPARCRYIPKNIRHIRRYGIPSKEYRCYVESTQSMTKDGF